MPAKNLLHTCGGSAFSLGSESQPEVSFFTAGGTLSPDAPSYVRRPPDDELFERLLRGEYCYVLTSRQMGKSSLMVRTARRLQEAGLKTAIVDLTRIGSVAIDPWYLGILTQLKSRLRLKVDVVAWWQERAALGVVQRLILFIQEVLLAEVSGRVVIFVDEIDSTLKLDFRDDFFAAIRALFNLRAEDRDFERLAFALLGVASPADLISDRSRTPFNIGQEITLRRFTRQDIQALKPGLEEAYPGKGSEILDRVYYWTNGHPYLTQRLCQELVAGRFEDCSQRRIDALVYDLFLTEKGSSETNLQFVRDTLLSFPQRRALLGLYGQVLKGKVVEDDRQSVLQAHLKLSGVVVAEDGVLKVHNELYRRAFNLAWIREHTPVNWSPYLAAVAIVVAVFLGGVFGFNMALENQMADHADCFINAVPDRDRLECLDQFFTRRPFLAKNNYPSRGVSLYLDKVTAADQVNLFNPSLQPMPLDRLVRVVQELYITLPDTEENGSTDPLLEAMRTALEALGGGSSPADWMAEEIGGWLEARKLARQGNPAQAVKDFKSGPLYINNKNKAVWYDYAVANVRLADIESDAQTRLAHYKAALDALDKVFALAKAERVPEQAQATLPPRPTRTPTQPPTATSPAAVTVVVGQFEQAPGLETPSPAPALTEEAPTASQTPSAPATLTQTPSPLPPTLTPTPTRTPTPLPTALPLRAINPGFATMSEIKAVVQRLIESSLGLAQALRGVSATDYPDLFRALPVEVVVSSALGTQSVRQAAEAQTALPSQTAEQVSPLSASPSPTPSSQATQAEATATSTPVLTSTSLPAGGTYLVEADSASFSLEYPGTKDEKRQSELKNLYTPFTRPDPLSGVSYDFWWRPTRPDENVVAVWNLPPEAPKGFYQIEIFVPGVNATTRKAAFEIISAGGFSNAFSLDFSQYYDIWVSLGEYLLEAGSQVRLSDYSDEDPPAKTFKGPVQFIPLWSGGLPPTNRFDIPVGSVAERNQTLSYETGIDYEPRWVENWWDANPFLTSYALGYSTGAALNLNGSPNADLGQPVYAIGDGEVAWSGEVGSWGGMVVIYHRQAVVRNRDGSLVLQSVFSRYAPLELSSITVKRGDPVSRGEQIGKIGFFPGNTNTAFLRFEVSQSDILGRTPGYWPEVSNVVEMQNAGKTDTPEYQAAAQKLMDEIWANFVDPLRFLVDNHNPFVNNP